MVQNGQLPSRAAPHLPRLGQGQAGSVSWRSHADAEQRRSAGDSGAADLSRIQELQRNSVFMPPWSACCDQRGKDGGGSLDCQCILSPLPGFDCAREGGASCCSVCHLSGAFAQSGRYRLYTHMSTHTRTHSHIHTLSLGKCSIATPLQRRTRNSHRTSFCNG